MRHVALELLQPPRSHLRQHRTLVRHLLGHHDVECTDPIACHEEQTLRVHRVDFAYFAAPKRWKGQALDGLSGHTRTSSRSGSPRALSANSGPTTSSRKSST